MRLFTLTALVVFCTCFQRPLASTVRSKRATVFSCDAGQTEIITPYDTLRPGSPGYADCGTLIGQYGDGYRMIYRTECQRWLGLRQLPDHAAKSYIFECERDVFNMVKFRAKVCCKEPMPPNRCFNCAGALDAYTCNYNNALVSCGAGEVCHTTYTCSAASNGQAPTLTKACMAEATCMGLSSSNPSTCASLRPEPGSSCTDCCSDPFCNFRGKPLLCLIAGAQPAGVCDTIHPCKRGGYCTNTKVAPFYSCCCPQGSSGVDCSIDVALCVTNHCQNGGTCLAHSNGARCQCHQGYIGDTCEFESKLSSSTCPGASTYVDLRAQGTPYSVDRSRTCSQIWRDTTADLRSDVSTCIYAMRDLYHPGQRVFDPRIDGEVTQIAASQLSYCRQGDQCTEHSKQLCCASCLSRPCLNGGWCVQTTGDTHTCRCRFGFTGAACEQEIATCFVMGEPHYRTFDNRWIHFQGPCTYNLVTPQQRYPGMSFFEVRVRNEVRGSATTVTYPQYVEAEFAGYVVRLGRNKRVTVNGQEVQPEYQGPTFVVYHYGRYVRLDTDFGLSVQFDGDYIISVQVPGSYKARLGGICGNADGDKAEQCAHDALLDTPDGHKKYGDCWLVPNTEDTSTNCDTPPPAECPQKQTYTSNAYCGFIKDPLGPFGSCSSDPALDVDGMFEACLQDLCADENNKCDVLRSFGETCKDAGHTVDWTAWRSAANCPYNCPTGMVYTTNPCHNSCLRRTHRDNCTDGQAESCTCVAGMVLQGNQCISSTRCPCIDTDGTQHAVGSKWDQQQISNGMCEEKSCLNGGYITTQQFSCRVPCTWSDWAEWGSCQSGDVSHVRSRQCDTSNCDDPCPGDASQTQTCQACLQNFDIAAECQRCDWTRNPRGYVNDPCACNKYYQCEMSSAGMWFGHHRSCQPCMCWNQDILTCVRDSNAPGQCATQAYNETVVHRAATCRRGASVFMQGSTPTVYIEVIEATNTKLSRPCAPGTVFDFKVSCGCVAGAHTVAIQPEFCLDFDNPNSRWRTGRGLYVDPANVAIASNGVFKDCAYFNGKANIEMPYFTNNEFNKFTWTLWYKRMGTTSNAQAILSNDDCKVDASMQIRSESASTTGGGIRTQVKNEQFLAVGPVQNYINAVTNINSAHEQWHHVVMTYNGERLDYYLDDKKVPSAVYPATGSTIGVNCPLLIGSQYQTSNFTGYMDQICFYKQAMSASDVHSLFTNPSSASIP